MINKSRNNPDFVFEEYMNNCFNKTFDNIDSTFISNQKKNFITKTNDEFLKNYRLLFNYDEKNVPYFSKYIQSNSTSNGFLKSDMLLKSAIPFIILIVFSIIGWITCCSCWCYDYCIFVCKKYDVDENKNKPNVYWKWIPIIVINFFGFSSLIPLYMKFSVYE